MNTSHLHSRPNILFVMTDQLRFDALGVTGGYVRTPHIDSIAQTGVCFTQCHTTAPVCIPARISLATGRYPHQIPIWQHDNNYTLSTTFPTWMQAVRDAGYRTSIFGKTHFHPHKGDLRAYESLMHDFGLDDVYEIIGHHSGELSTSYLTDYWKEKGLLEAFIADMRSRMTATKPEARASVLNKDDYRDSYVGRKAAEYLSGYNRDEPWMCWVSFPGPHDPWDAPLPYDTMYDPSQLPPPIPRKDFGLFRDCILKARMSMRDKSNADLTLEEVANLRANYFGKVSLIDDQVGHILEVIKQRGEMDNTLIVFTSDHGDMNGDHGLFLKSCFFDAAVRVPLIIKQPGNAQNRSSVQSNALVELMDVGSTIADYAQSQTHEFFEAKSLKPLVEGATSTHRDMVLSEFKGELMLADAHWKVVINQRGKVAQLFNRVADPDEQTNLAETINYDPAVSRLLMRAAQLRTSIIQ